MIRCTIYRSEQSIPSRQAGDSVMYNNNTGNGVTAAVRTMLYPHRLRSIGRSAFPYLVTAVICVLVLNSIYKLPTIDLKIPLVVDGDATFYAMVVKNFVETGHYYVNPLLGAPGQQEMYDFPVPHATHLVGFAILRLFTRDYGVVLNLYYLLTYPLIAMTALYAFRRLGISTGLSIAGGVLFAFLPFHVLRSEGHLMHTSYYLIPLLILTVLRIAHGHPLFGFVTRCESAARPPLVTADGVFAAIICVLVASDNPYWALFSGIFLVLGGVIGHVRYRHHGTLYSACILASVLTLAFMINLSPNIIYAHKHGLNPVNHRAPSEAEVYGGRITQLVLPVSGHRIRALAEWKSAYYAGAPLVNENDTASLGIAGTIGFCTLLGCLFVSRRSDLLDSLSVLNIAAVLIGTMGGFGALFSFVVWSQFRGYNRISVYIGFFSILALLLVLDTLLKASSRRVNAYVALCVVPFILLVVGLCDEIPKHFLPNRRSVEADYHRDQALIDQIASMVPPHSMIFELPYVPFLGSVPANTRMIEYDEFKGYLHSRSLRWSGGAVIDRETDRLIRELAAMPVAEMVVAVSEAGFAGIYVDRYGYLDHGVAIESRLRAALGIQPIVSQNSRRSFFLLDPTHIAELRRLNRPQEYTEVMQAPTRVSTGDGCWPLEGTVEHNWHWCGREGEIIISNPTNKTRNVKVEMVLATGHPELSSITVSGPGFNQTLQANDSGTLFSMGVLARPGDSVFSLTSNARAVVSATDPRTLVFLIRNLQLLE